MGSILCEHCTAACCRYLAVPLDPPRSARDYDDIRWYLMHEGILVFVEEGSWYIQFATTCRHLGADNRCTVYETRPDICRDYEPGNCDYVGGTYGYDHLFTHPRQIEEFYEGRTKKKLRPLQEAAAAERMLKKKTGTGGRAKKGRSVPTKRQSAVTLTLPLVRK